MEIDCDLKLTLEEIRTLDVHSVLNILNVVIGEFLELGEKCPEFGDIEVFLGQVYDFADSIRSGSFTFDTLFGIQAFGHSLIEQIGERSDLPENATETLINLRSIFSIFDIRLEELKDRKDDPFRWESFDVDILIENFKKVFEAISKNSKGAYDFVFDESLQGDRDYWIDLKIKGQGNGKMLMPSVFQDIIRDLMANARKYTLPGGNISASVVSDRDLLQIEISDNGLGISESDLPDVVEFGSRGGNVLKKKTYGGGFGLTKAYYMVKLFGGRMWIDSSVKTPSGTRVRIELPIPELGSTMK